MNKEKEAIEHIVGIKSWWWNNSPSRLYCINGADIEQFDILLNLIDKLQKELDNSISKDIIRAKIKEVAEEPQIYVDTEKFDIEFEKSNYTIKVFKELLGGE